MFGSSLAAAAAEALAGLRSTTVPSHYGPSRYRYLGGRPPRGKTYPNANALGISPKVHKRFQEAANLLESAIHDAYFNGLENGGEVWDAKVKGMVNIREASPAAVLSDMMDCSSDVFDRLRVLSRLYFPDGHHRAAALALKVLKNKRRVWNRRVPVQAS